MIDVPRRAARALAVVLCFGPVLLGAAAPDVSDVRAVFKDVETLRAAGKLKKKTAPISEFEEASLYTDDGGRARLYVESLGGQDSVVTVSQRGSADHAGTIGHHHPRKQVVVTTRGC
jgi:hypothetical protein